MFFISNNCSIIFLYAIILVLSHDFLSLVGLSWNNGVSVGAVHSGGPCLSVDVEPRSRHHWAKNEGILRSLTAAWPCSSLAGAELLSEVESCSHSSMMSCLNHRCQLRVLQVIFNQTLGSCRKGQSFKSIKKKSRATSPCLYHVCFYTEVGGANT